MDDSRARPHEQFDGEDDFQLMEWIVISRDDDPDMAWRAWACLYERHVRYLYGVVLKRAQDVFKVSDAAEDLVRATFIKVFEKAHTFEPTDESLDGEGKSRKFRAWISVIAVNLIRDAQREHMNVPAHGIDYWEDIPEDETKGQLSASIDRICQIMGTALNEREQEILRATMSYYDPSTGKAPKLPPEEVSRLCKVHGITSENLRQIRRRAMQTLKEVLKTSRLAG